MPHTPSASSQRNGVLLALTAMLFFTLADFSWKHAQAEGASFMYVVMISMLVTTIGCIIYALAKGKSLFPRNKRFQLMYGCIWTAELSLFSYALGNMPMVELFIIILTTPLVTAFAAYLFLGESLRLNQIIALCFAFISIAVMLVWKETSPVHFGTAPLISYLAAFASLFGNSGKQLLLRGFRHHDASHVTLFYGSLIFVTVALILGAGQEFTTIAPSINLMLLALGIVGSTGALLFIRAFQLAPASVISPTQYSQLLWVAICGGILFGEPLTLPSIFGMVAIFISGYIFYRGNGHIPKKNLLSSDKRPTT